LYLLLAVVQPVVAGRQKTKWHEIGDIVPYPEEAQPFLEQQDSNLAALAPKVSVITSLPDPDTYFIWPWIQNLAIRNYESKIMNVQAVYMIKSGLEMGCRIPKDDGHGNTTNGEHTAIDSPICDDHCTHKGRYCHAELPGDLARRNKYSGRDLILEISRRLCFGSVLEGTYANPLWFEYLGTFDKSKCILREDMTLKVCSEEIMSNITSDFSKGKGNTDHQIMEKVNTCVTEADAETDSPNAMLENQLKLFQETGYTRKELPVLDVGGKKFEGGYRDDHVTQFWCEIFPEPEVKVVETFAPGIEPVNRPITCDFCAGCNYVLHCLQHNKCDNHIFNISTFHDPKGKLEHETNPIEAIVVEDVEVVAEDVTISVMWIMAGAAIFLAVCSLLARRRRQRAIAEVAKELPLEGYNDTDNNGGGANSIIEEASSVC